MASPYSNDLRERVAASVVGGRSVRATAPLFGVSVASAVKWSQRLRATGSAAVRPMGRKQDRSLEGERERLLGRLEAVPDLTLRALVVELRDRGVTTSYGSVWRIVRDAGMTFKRTLFAVEQLRPKIARRRAQWKKYQGRLDPRRPVFIDGSEAEAEGDKLGPRPT